MGIDIKFPIGLMFTILGLLLTIFGVATSGDSALYSRSLGININLWSGAGMLIFGVIMLWFAWRSNKTKTR
jgi:uncharacterized membrane protein